MRRSLLTLTACLITTSQALAHPGHGVTEGHSLVHYLLEPLHVGPVLLLLAAGIATLITLNRRKKSLRQERVRK